MARAGSLRPARANSPSIGGCRSRLNPALRAKRTVRAAGKGWAGRAGLLADAEAGKDSTDHLVGRDASEKLAEMVEGRAQAFGGDGWVGARAF